MMEGGIEREYTALGGLFNQIMSDMKNGTPLWEDLVVKATKLHSCLRATLNAISSYLDAFQKIADAATNTRGATKEIGTALTRICLRHKAVEARMRMFTSAIMDCLVIPLQEKLEDWKKALVNLDKEHTKDYKRARSELKKRSTDTLRLQKKAKKGSKELQRRVECSLQDMTERKLVLEEIEKKAVRSALIEERSRFCLLVAFLKPVVDEEVAMLSELSHLQEVVDQLEKHSADPHTLPPASEQVINDVKSSDNWTVQSPPSSPGSLGSRKSSMCSISSLTSSSSGSSKSHHSPSHHHWHRSLSHQAPVAAMAPRPAAPSVASVFSQDSGFTSQDTLFNSQFSSLKVSGTVEQNNVSTPCGNGSSTVISHPTSTWPNLQESLQFERAATAIINDRPHTISTAYERGHHRPPLTVYTFQAVHACHSQPASPVGVSEGLGQCSNSPSIATRPPVPHRGSSLERPQVTKPRPHHPITAALIQHSGLEITQPMYVNMHELASLAASKAQEMNFPPPPPSEGNNQQSTPQGETNGKDGNTSESSVESFSGFGSQSVQSSQDDKQTEGSTGNGFVRNSLLRRGSVQGHKPAPPVRRTSSISVSGGTVTYSRIQALGQSSQGSLDSQSSETLPPPPPFLLDSQTSSSIANKAARFNHTSGAVTSSSESRATISEYQRTAAMGIAAEIQRKTAAQQALKESQRGGELKQSGISVAETVRTLTQLNHTPASPASLRRTGQATGLAHLTASTGAIQPCSTTVKISTNPVGGQPSGIVAAILARQTSAKEKLERDKEQSDPRVAHDSLMDQIKRGTHLRKTSTVNDRSAPRIH
ncbi:missing-in-metastasis isoform X3 [Rhodnius prolixus]|uniref:missing-in-metastasis isoform X3 n=1 Tax=Rhodnius prolixus TaxID=13249 RepID=UPI003D18AA03